MNFRLINKFLLVKFFFIKKFRYKFQKKKKQNKNKDQIVNSPPNVWGEVNFSCETFWREAAQNSAYIIGMRVEYAVKY